MAYILFDIIAWLVPVIFALQSSCVVVFIRELTDLLKSATVPKASMDDYNRLQGNLEKLNGQQVSQQNIYDFWIDTEFWPS